MGFFGKIFLASGLCILVAACAKDKGIDLKSSLPPTGMGPKIRASSDTPGGTAIIPGGNAAPATVQITPQEDIAWTGFDGEGIPELENLMAAPKRGPWEESITIARQTAAREGKPVLIWFTDSDRSPMCKTLSSELFGTDSFGKWAENRIVRLRIDSNLEAAKEPTMTMDEWATMKTEAGSYVRTLKKRYKVIGHPTILMLNPSGEVLWKDSGYTRGEADFLWGLIKQAEAASSYTYQSWRKNLEKKGYREWEGISGRKVFAKLVSYSKGTLILIEPGGERYKTAESRLSKNDKKWIKDQKASRGIE